MFRLAKLRRFVAVAMASAAGAAATSGSHLQYGKDAADAATFIENATGV